MSNKCPNCGKTVYFAERVQASGKDYHKLCLKCANCKKQLAPGGFSEKDGIQYCKNCYAGKFNPAGYGFGGAATRDDYTSLQGQ